MGRLLYGPQQRDIEIDDRTLAHLKIVILSKLRRGESFAFSWENDAGHGSGRHTIWLNPTIPLEFQFLGNRQPSLNRAWLSALTTAVERGDLHLVPEPDAPVEESPGASRW